MLDLSSAHACRVVCVKCQQTTDHGGHIPWTHSFSLSPVEPDTCWTRQRERNLYHLRLQFHAWLQLQRQKQEVLFASFYLHTLYTILRHKGYLFSSSRIHVPLTSNPCLPWYLIRTNCVTLHCNTYLFVSHVSECHPEIMAIDSVQGVPKRRTP